jgi:DNA-binding SARP family transcriptional activator/TolB-like protein/Tfp pilus assembly protein PilF
MVHHLRTFSGPDLTDADGREVRALITQPKRIGLLVYLALGGPRLRRRDTAVALFWPELDQEHARGALRQALRFIRRAVGENVVVARGDEEIGVDGSLLRCDALAFEEACRAGRAEHALALYAGDFLDGYYIADAAPELEQWIDQERRRLRQLAAESAWTLAARLKDTGDVTAAGACARRAAELWGLDETELRRVVRFLDSLGDRAGAIAAYEAFARRLKREYGVDPAAESQTLLVGIREESRRASAAEHSSIGPTSVVAATPDVSAAVTRVPSAAPTDRQRRVLTLTAIVGAFALIGYLVGFARSTGARHPGLRVAVVPLLSVGGDSTRAAESEVVTDELIADLATAPRLQLISGRSMARLGASGAGPSVVARQAARELGADAVVFGAIEQQRDSVRVTLSIAMAGRSRPIWTRTMRGVRSDLLRMESEIAAGAARQLQTIVGADRPMPTRPARATSVVALDLYEQGRHWWNKRGRANLLKSIGLFSDALDVDPRFALAYSGIGDAYVQLGYGSWLAPDDAFPKAAAAATRALQLDSTLAEPHATLGFVKMYYDWDWPGAEREFRRALALNPSFATAHEWYGLFLAAMGRFDEAVASERRAQALDPLSTSVGGTAGWVYYYAGRMDEAAPALDVALRMDSTFSLGHFYLGRVLQERGQLDSALAQYAATGTLRSWVPTVAAEANLLARAGRAREARALLARMDSIARSTYVTAYGYALVHAALGDRDSTFVWLERALSERTHWLVWLNRDPRWRPVRDDPRFAALVQRVGLPP